MRMSGWALSASDPLERFGEGGGLRAIPDGARGGSGRSGRAKGGRPPYDAGLMFKVLVLQTLYSSVVVHAVPRFGAA